MAELGAADRPTITVFNKADAATPAQLAAAHRTEPAGLPISALTGMGLPALRERCRELAVPSHGPVKLLIPPSRYDVIAKLHSLGRVHQEEHTEAGVLLEATYPAAQEGFFAPFALGKGIGA